MSRNPSQPLRRERRNVVVAVYTTPAIKHDIERAAIAARRTSSQWVEDLIAKQLSELAHQDTASRAGRRP